MVNKPRIKKKCRVIELCDMQAKCQVCQKQVERAGTNDYIPQILWDVIICSSHWYLFLIQHSSYNIDIYPKDSHKRIEYLKRLVSFVDSQIWSAFSVYWDVFAMSCYMELIYNGRRLCTVQKKSACAIEWNISVQTFIQFGAFCSSDMSFSFK